MKKKLLAVLMATALTGCGDKKDQGGAGGNNGGDSSSDPVEALIASTDGAVNLSVWAAEEDQDMVKGWCDAFAAQYPEVTFNFSVGVQSESTARIRF